MTQTEIEGDLYYFSNYYQAFFSILLDYSRTLEILEYFISSQHFFSDSGGISGLSDHSRIRCTKSLQFSNIFVAPISFYVSTSK